MLARMLQINSIEDFKKDQLAKELASMSSVQKIQN